MGQVSYAFRVSIFHIFKPHFKQKVALLREIMRNSIFLKRNLDIGGGGGGVIAVIVGIRISD